MKFYHFKSPTSQNINIISIVMNVTATTAYSVLMTLVNVVKNSACDNDNGRLTWFHIFHLYRIYNDIAKATFSISLHHSFTQTMSSFAKNGIPRVCERVLERVLRNVSKNSNRTDNETTARDCSVGVLNFLFFFLIAEK